MSTTCPNCPHAQHLGMCLVHVPNADDPHTPYPCGCQGTRPLCPLPNCGHPKHDGRCLYHVQHDDGSARCDEDGHCTRCGTLWQEENTTDPHVCPPGFTAVRCTCPGPTQAPAAPHRSPEVQAAFDEIYLLCQGRNRWTMRVPVQSTDSDVVISNALLLLEAQRNDAINALNRKAQEPPISQALPIDSQLRSLLVDADSALSLIFYRKRIAVRELGEDFEREVQRLLPLLRLAWRTK